MERGDLAEFGKNSQIMIFLPHFMWAENNKNRKHVYEYCIETRWKKIIRTQVA